MLVTKHEKEKTAVKQTKPHSAFQKFYKTFEEHPYLVFFITALVLNSIIEIYSRHSLLEYLTSIVESPFVFIYSVLIITFTLSVSLLFSKRIFAYILISTLWFLLGAINGTLLLLRVTPLTGVDFAIVWSVLGIADVYLKPWQIVLIAAFLILVIALMVILAVKTPKSKTFFKKFGLRIASLGLALFLATNIGLKAGAISDEFPNLADAYDKYGFAYCFSRSVLDTGIKKPVGFNEIISDVEENIDDEMLIGDTPSDSEAPNIIVVQLESFFDPTYMTEYELSEDPIPNFRHLKETCASGFLTVPVIGAGTVNTEFEVLTGMCLDFFGTCEYPFQTILRDTPTCSLGTDLKDNGYTAHAMHNNTATFYDRNIVYSYLGFDTFTSLEYMEEPTYNEIDWAKDDVLTGEITKALNSTDGRDFVFAVSVQAHGKYPGEERQYPITVTGGENQELTNGVEYYVNQIYEVDRFIGNLTQVLTEYDEPVVLVLYGDHLPTLELTDDTLTTGDIFKTEYVLWSNCGINAESRDLEAWQLSSYIMETLNLSGGPVTTLHLECGDDEDFKQQLEALAYDLLYGDFTLFDGVNPYTPTDLQMGSEIIQVTGWFESGGCLYVKGNNFTEFSVVHTDGEKQETVFINEYTIMVKDIDLPDDGTVTVAQMADDSTVLSWAEVK